MTLLNKDRGAALITVVILIIVLTILSTVMLSILSNQTRYIEHNISRTKAKYATEGVMVRALDDLRRTNTTSGPQTIPGRYDNSAQNWSVNVTREAGQGISSTDRLNLSVDYTAL